ncbi:hypothetical protein ES703_51597 [subsurface metagenome]
MATESPLDTVVSLLAFFVVAVLIIYLGWRGKKRGEKAE